MDIGDIYKNKQTDKKVEIVGIAGNIVIIDNILIESLDMFGNVGSFGSREILTAAELNEYYSIEK